MKYPIYPSLTIDQHVFYYAKYFSLSTDTALLYILRYRGLLISYGESIVVPKLPVILDKNEELALQYYSQCWNLNSVCIRHQLKQGRLRKIIKARNLPFPGQRLKQRKKQAFEMRDRGMTQEKIAAVMDVTPATISLWMQDRKSNENVAWN